MKRKGFALLTVLWVIAALSLTASDVLVVARSGLNASYNRTVIRRAEWAREACEAILRARYAADSLTRAIDRVDLGNGTWCEARLIDAGTLGPRHLALTVDTGGTSGASVRVLAVDEIAGRRVNLNVASDSVIATVTGMPWSAARNLVLRRQSIGAFGSMEEVVSSLPQLTAKSVLADFPRFLSRTTLRPVELMAQIEGGVSGAALRSHSLLVLTPAGKRLIVRRRDEL